MLNGATDYLSVLTNLINGQQLQREVLTARLVLLNNRIALYRALASGIEPADMDWGTEPTDVVAAALPEASARVQELVRRWRQESNTAKACA